MLKGLRLKLRFIEDLDERIEVGGPRMKRRLVNGLNEIVWVDGGRTRKEQLFHEGSLCKLGCAYLTVRISHLGDLTAVTFWLTGWLFCEMTHMFQGYRDALFRCLLLIKNTASILLLVYIRLRCPTAQRASPRRETSRQQHQARDTSIGMKHREHHGVVQHFRFI